MVKIEGGKIKFNEEVKVKYEVDVLVVGGGTAGFGAAISASRNGANTMLVEKYGALGGLVTLGLVCYMAGYPEGIGKELLERLKEKRGLGENRICDPEITKYIMEKMAIESGVKILYWTYVIDSIVENNEIKGVIIQNISGRSAILAKRVIDCTGDAEISYFAGVPVETGWDLMDGYNQAVSLDFVMSNVDLNSFSSSDFYSTVQMKIEKAVKEGKLPRLVEKGYLGSFPNRPEEKTEVYVCTAHSRKCRTTDAEDLTRIVIEQRDQIQKLVEFYRENVIGFEKAFLSYTASILGIRESRRIVGEYKLTGKDIALARKFKDAIARDTHGFDIHNPIDDLPHIKHTHLSQPIEPAFCTDKEREDGRICCVKNNPKGKYRAYLKPGQYYEIPYRCLIPKKIDNLLVAGRCISTDFEAQSGTRLIMTCITMGHAAGTASALSIKENISPRKLDTEILREKLIKEGINLNKEPLCYVKGSPQDIPRDAEFVVETKDGEDEIRIKR
ncbi:MAG: FAD-dependent oxidoreductase [Candidatus Omnitrophica bacterium]|nr:FAD-dependent oxidoreductase [Candidatus Omnitrophota bacterium]